MRPLVLHVAEFRNPAGGGFVAGLARLAERHPVFETALLCPDDRFSWARALRAAGVRIHVARRHVEVTAAIARLRPTIVHAHFVSWSIAATIGGAAARARLAWHLHSGVPSTAPATIARRLKYAAARRLVDRFYCVSPDLIEYLRRLGVPTAQIVALPNGIDLDRFHPPSLAERVAARRGFGLAPRDRAIAFFGRDALVKGADRLAAALRVMHAQPAVIGIACSPRTLELLAGARTIDAGHLADVRTALWAADAIALPSRSEGIAYSLLEARACALPAVVSALPGVKRVLGADAGTIPVDDPGDAISFARALERALEGGTAPLAPSVAAGISLDAWTDALAAWYLDEAAA